jgi:hypothetical protein
VDEKRAGRSQLGHTRTDTEYCAKVEHLMDTNDSLFSDVPSVYFFTYVDKDGYVPDSVGVSPFLCPGPLVCTRNLLCCAGVEGGVSQGPQRRWPPRE